MPFEKHEGEPMPQSRDLLGSIKFRRLLPHIPRVPRLFYFLRRANVVGDDRKTPCLARSHNARKLEGDTVTAPRGAQASSLGVRPRRRRRTRRLAAACRGPGRGAWEQGLSYESLEGYAQKPAASLFPASPSSNQPQRE